ncbi:insulin-like growth factor-binding protein-related protein 1 [Glandiceps talaboti]
MKMLLVTLAAVFVLVRAQGDLLPKCEPCKPEECTRQFGCVSGMVKDRCDCCDVCGNREGMRCDRDEIVKVNPQKYKYGKCGKNLQCKAHPESTPAEPFTVCYCKHNDIVCGTNGKTYLNVCQMMADAYRFGKKVSVKRVGPCPSAPWINTPPRSLYDVTVHDITLSCEVTGYPAPLIEWRKTVNGESKVLPGDDRHIAVQSRGGPEKNQLTGWLQIQGLRKIDEAEYTCTARNGYGQVHGKATITLSANFVEKVDEEDEENEATYEEEDYDTESSETEEETGEQVIPTEEDSQAGEVSPLFPEERDDSFLGSGDEE